MNIDFLKKIIIIYSLAIFVFIGLYVFVFIKIKNYSEQIAFLENEILVQSDIEQRMSYMNEVISQNQEDIDLIQNSVVSSSGDVAFIETLEELSRENNLSINIQSLSFEDSNTLSEKEMTFFKIRAVVRGSWQNVYTFVADLEALPVSLKIDNLAMIYSLTESGGSVNSEWQLNFDIRVLKYK